MRRALSVSALMIITIVSAILTPFLGAAAFTRWHGEVYSGKLADHERGDCLVNVQHCRASFTNIFINEKGVVAKPRPSLKAGRSLDLYTA